MVGISLVIGFLGISLSSPGSWMCGSTCSRFINFVDVSVIGVGGIKCMLGIGGCLALGWDGGSVFLDGMLSVPATSEAMFGV